MRNSRKCLYCGTLTENPKFCSKSCAATFNNRISVKRHPINGRCLACGVPVRSDREDKRYCTDKCAYKYGDFVPKSLSEFISGKFGKRAITVAYTHIREYVLKSQGGVCAICGCLPAHNGLPLTFILDHVDGNSDNNLPNNVRLICPNCDTQLPTFKGRNTGNGRHYRRSRYREGKSY